MDTTLNTLVTRGWVVLSGAGFTDGTDTDHAAVLRIARRFGVPSDRDGGTAIWPVTPRKSGAGDTFSVRDGEAWFHTDAAYRPDPENRFALFCVRPADDGGTSRLLCAHDALTQAPEDTVALLRKPVWRWVPPATFGGPRDISRPVWTDDGRIRWRLDNLDVDARHRAVGRAFADHLERHPAVVEHHLLTDSVLICDNQRVLHGRSWFADPRRLVLRVRLTT